MPQIGDTTSSHLLGRKNYHKLIWHACIDCGNTGEQDKTIRGESE